MRRVSPTGRGATQATGYAKQGSRPLRQEEAVDTGENPPGQRRAFATGNRLVAGIHRQDPPGVECGDRTFGTTT